MKKFMALLLAVMMTLSLVACGNKTGDVDNIVVDGQETAAVDFLVEHLKAYTASEGYLERQQIFETAFETEAKPLTVTRVIEVAADNLGENQLSVHFLAVKADCDWGKNDSEFFSNILLVVDYETGEVYDEFVADPSWADKNGTKEQEIFYMLNGPLCGDGYKSGTIIVDSETRIELPKEDVAAINAALNG